MKDYARVLKKLYPSLALYGFSFGEEETPGGAV